MRPNLKLLLLLPKSKCIHIYRINIASHQTLLHVIKEKHLFCKGTFHYFPPISQMCYYTAISNFSQLKIITNTAFKNLVIQMRSCFSKSYNIEELISLIGVMT